MSMKGSDHPIGRSDGLLTQDVRDEVLVYDLSTDKVLCLNQTTAEIWRHCDGTKSVADISRAVSAKLEVDLSDDVAWMALSQLKDMHLLADDEAFATPFDGMSRREMVRRIGLAAAVALPVIFEVVAPSAVHAQSVSCNTPIGNCSFSSTTACICNPIQQPGNNNNPEGCPCATNGDCQGNCQCGAPCTAGVCGPGEVCQSGVCFLGQVNMGTTCNGSCPPATTCNPDGSCAGVCPPSPFNFCIGGNTNPICIPDNGGNLSAPCCPCTIDGDCAGNCSNGMCV